MEVDGCDHLEERQGCERALKGICKFFFFQGRWMDGDMELWMWISKCE